MTVGKKPGLAAGAKFYARQLRVQALEIELAAMTREERIENAVSIAGKICDAADVAESRREGAATARAKKRVSKKAEILAEIERAQANGWSRGDASRIARKFGLKMPNGANYVRRLANKKE